MSTGLKMSWDENSIARVKQSFKILMDDFSKNGDININFANKEVFDVINKEINNIQKKLNLGELKVDGTKIRETLAKTVNSVSDVEKELSKFGQVEIKNKIFDENGLKSFTAELRTAEGLIQKIKYGASGYQSGTKGNLIPSEYKIKTVNENDGSSAIAKGRIAELQNLEKEFTNVMKSESTKREQVVNAESKARIDMANKEQATIEKIQDSITSTIKKREDDRLALAKSQASSTNKSLEDNYNKIIKLQTELNNLQLKNKGIIQGGETQKFDDLSGKIKTLTPKDTSGITKATKELKDYEIQLKEVQRVAKLGEKMMDLPKDKNISANTKELKQYITQLYDGKAKIKGFSDTFDSSGQKVKKFNVELKESNGQIRKETVLLDESTNALYKNSSATGDNTNKKMSMGARLKEAFRGFVSFAGVMGVIYGGIRQVKEGISIISELDEKQTNIRMITGMNRETVQGLTKDYSGLATELKTTTREIMGGAEEFLRAGHSIDETRTLLKASTIGSAVSGQENSAMAEQLIAISNGFQMATNDSKQMMHVIDTLSTLDNNSATSMKEISEAMQHSASSAKDAGVSFDQLSTYIATVSSVSRKSASSIGESFKTIFARFSNVKLNKVLEDDEQTLSDVEASMGKVGINIRKTKDEFKDFNVVLDELKPKWKTMTDVEKSMVGGALAGTRQRENFLILVDNMSQTDSLLQKVGDSAGSAEEKFNDAFKDSLKASVSEFKNEVEKLWMVLLKGDFLKSIVQTGTSFIKTLEILATTAKETKLQMIGVGIALGVSLAVLRTFIVGSIQAGTSMSFLSVVTKLFTGATVGAATATSGLTAALNFLFLTPAGIVLTGITFALGVAGVAIYKNIKAQKDLKEATDRTTKSYEDFNKALSDFDLKGAENELKPFEEKQNKINELLAKRAELEDKVQKAKEHKGVLKSVLNNGEYDEVAQQHKLNKNNEELRQYIAQIEAEGGTVDSLTGHYKELDEMRSKFSTVSVVQGLEDDRNAMIKQGDEIVALVEKYQSLSTMDNKSPGQQSENNRTVDDLVARYSDLNVVIDENGNKQIENTALLTEKVGTLNEEKDTILSSIDAYANWIEAANTYEVRQQEIEMIQAQISEYIELMNTQGRSAEQSNRMSDLAFILAGRYGDLSVKLDENGNAQILNTDLLNIKNNALDTERQAIFNNIGAYEEWSGKTIWLQGETTKVTLSQARARISILRAEREALIARQVATHEGGGGSSYAGGMGTMRGTEDWEVSNLLGDYDISLIKLQDKLNNTSVGGGGGKSYPSGGGYKPTNPSKGGSSGRTPTTKQDVQDLDLKIDRYATLREALEQVNYSLDRNKQKQDQSNNPNKINLLRDEISLLKKKQEALNSIWEEQQREKSELESVLRNGGFSITDGVITNFKAELESWVSWANAASGDTKKERQEQTKEIEEKAKRYLSLMGDIRSTNKDWYEIDNTIRKIKTDQIKMLEDAEKTITDMFKKQVEERKKAIDDEYNKRVESLNKTKELYNKKNAEEDFEKDLGKEKQILQEMKTEIAKASRNTSNEGKAMLENLRKEAETQQLKIDEMIVNNQRSKNNQIIDDKIKALEEESKSKQESLDKEWSDSKIAKVVSEALANGFFQDVNGKFVDLKDSYVNWMNEFNNGTSIAGQKIKDEFITNLQQVKLIMTDIKEISADIGFNYSTPEIINKPGIASAENLFRIIPPTLFSPESVTGSSNKGQTFQIDSLLNIEGNVDDSMLDKLDTMVDMVFNKFTAKMSDLNFQMS